MTVSASYAPLVSAGNGATTAFAPSWPFFTSAEIKVTLIDSNGVETVKSLTTHYTVSGGTDSDGLPATGTITMLTAPAVGETLVIERVTTNTQATSYVNNDAFGAKTHEAAYDRRTLVEQEAKEIASRALQANPKLTLTGRNFKVAGTGWIKWDDTDGFTVNPAASAGDMEAATYDPAGISEQLVGLTATQTLTNKTLTQPVITLEQGASVAPTAEGRIAWDTDDNKIKVGDGATTKTFSDDSVNAATYAPLDSPALIGAPTSPTADVGTNTTQIATTAFVKTALDALIASAPGALDTLDELAAALGDDANFASTITTALAGKVATADLASQAEAEAGTNNTKWMTPLRTAQAIGALGGGGGSGVSSFNGRTGAVSPASGDYAIADVTGLQTALDAKAPLASPTFSGYLGLTGAAGTYRLHNVSTNGLGGRWQWGADNSAESGGNTGSDWHLYRYDDGGSYLSVPIAVKRTTGFVGFNSVNPDAPITVATGSGAGQYAIRVLESDDATSNRASILLGDWLMMQDVNGNGNRDFSLYQGAYSVLRMFIGATGNFHVCLNGTEKMGVNTWSTNSQLNVGGVIESLSGGFKFPDGTTQTTAAVGGGIKGLQVLTASGTYTRTSGASKALVIALGGGAGGQTWPTRGGGSGEMRWALVTPAATETATIGAGGSPDGNGGATSLGALITANGGTAAAAGTGGSGGSQLPTGTGSGLTTDSEGGQGGGNMLGQGGIKSVAGNHAATGYGAGGYADTGSPGSGRPGVLIIIEF